MLADGIILVNDSIIGRKSQNFGTTFPAAPTDLDTFEIVGGSVVPHGVYIYSAGILDWVLSENAETGPYDIGLTVFDRPRSLDIIAKHLAVRTFILNANFANSLAAANINASSTTVINIYRTIGIVDTLVGTLTFNANVRLGTFATVGGKSIIIARGHTLKFVAPELRDATLSSIDITLSGRILSAGAI